MSSGGYRTYPVDCIYVSASTLDARLTRMCVASIRRVYPDIPVRLLVGGRLQFGLAKELSRYWNVQVADFERGDYGWGYVKLEPLFAPAGETFLMLDSDTVLTGPVLERLDGVDAQFVVDNEDYAQEAIPDRYYDWRKLRPIDPKAQPPRFVFNSGQWIGSSGILSRSDFDPWVNWSFPRSLKHQDCFFPGDQGVLNYVLVQKAMLEELGVARRPLMCWPGHGLGDINAETIKNNSAPATIIHWAGMKDHRLRSMVGADILAYFEELYYERLPAARLRRRAAIILTMLELWGELLRMVWRQNLRKIARRMGRSAA